MPMQLKNQGVLKLQPHDHACLIYESENEWRENVIPFIMEGLKRGEKCIYGLNHRNRQVIIDCLQEEGINSALYENSGQLLILDKSVLPTEGDGDRLNQMLDFYIQFLEQCLAEGYPAVRFTSEALYTLMGLESAKNMVEVNSRMNTTLFPHYPCVALCQYDRCKTDPKLLKYAIISHPLIIKNGEIYVNLSSICDEGFLEVTSDRWEAEHWLAIIERENREVEQAELALQSSEEKYRLIVDNAYDGISIFDYHTFTSVYQNPALKQMLGYPGEAWLSKHIFEYVHPDDRALAEQKVQKGLEKGEGSMQCRIKKNDGSYIWLEINGKVINPESDNPQLLFITRDISERKRVEEELIASQAELRFSEQELKHQLDYLNYLINTMSEVFVIYDLNQHISFVNKAIYKQLGYQPEEILGQNVIDFIVPSYRDRMATYIRDRLYKGEAGIFETVVKRKDSSEALVRIKSSPIKENDAVVGVMLLMEDISEYRKIQKEMARLDQLNTVGEIAAGIGHEIRNPMTTVKGFLQILSQHEDFTSHQHYFNLMLEELERANAIITEFLALAKNKLVDLQPRNLNSIITALSPLLQADAMLADKSIILNLSEIPDLLLDEKEIRQLLLNLVRNGLEAMQAGGRVNIATRLEEEQVVLSVQDEGKGIDSEMLEKLGTPFFTTKDNGTGLGLAICFSIVARHEASIQPYTSPTGSTFVVRFKVPPLSLGQMTLPLI